MKIAVWHSLPSGGGKRALYYHVRGLVKRGHQVACWSLDSADQSYLPLSEFAPERILSTEFPTRTRKRFTDRWLSPYAEEVHRMRAFDDACRRCAGEIEAGDFDLLFANSTGYYNVPYVMSHARLKKVLYLQEPCRFLYEARPMLPWVSGTSVSLKKPSLLNPFQFMTDYRNLQSLRLRAKQEWLNVQACDRLLVNSYFSRESVLRAYGVDATVCYLGVDTDLFRNLNLERERFIVGLGSFDSIKGIELAIEAVALLPEPRPPLVWIANSGNQIYEETIRKLALSSGVELQIRMAISDAELVDTLNRAALLLYTSKLEPFGFAVIEANACGLPVVGVAEGGVRETVKDDINGLLVEANAASISSAVNKLLQNPTLARRIGEQGAMSARRDWNVDASVERLETILQQVVSH